MLGNRAVYNDDWCRYYPSHSAMGHGANSNIDRAAEPHLLLPEGSLMVGIE